MTNKSSGGFAARNKRLELHIHTRSNETIDQSVIEQKLPIKITCTVQKKNVKNNGEIALILHCNERLVRRAGAAKTEQTFIGLKSINQQRS